MRRLTDWLQRKRSARTSSGAAQNAIDASPTGQDRPHGVVWFDVTDVLAFLRKQPNVTGIQRVQLECTLAMLLDDPEHNKCCFFPENGEWLELNVRDFCRVFTEYSQDLRGSRAQLTIYLEDCQTAQNANIKDGDTLLLLGGTWNIPGLFESLRDLQFDGVDCVFYIHDLLPLSHPELFVDVHADMIADWFKDVQSVASGLLCNSDETRAAVLELSGYDGPIEVADLNISPKAKAADPEHKLDAAATRGQSDVLERYDLVGREYVLMVGTLEPRKNHATALNAWTTLHKTLGDTCPKLVIAGYTGWKSEGVMAQLAMISRYNCVEVIQDASDVDLEELYRSCLCTLYLSRAEGWGLPVTESIAAGRPVVCGAGSCAQRATQGLAIQVDELSERNVTETFLDLFTNRQKLQDAEKRIQRSASFQSWKDFGAQVRHQARLMSTQKMKGKLPEAELGVVYDFGASEDESRPANSKDGRHFLRGKGWHPPEEWGIWAQQTSSALRFAVSEPQICTAFLRVVTPQTDFDISVVRKSEELARAKVDQPSWIEVPLGKKQADPDVFLHIQTDKLMDMSKIKTNADIRVLGFGLAEICVVHSDDEDAKARILGR